MKICRISKAFFPVIDGAANHVLELSRQQSLKGHEVWILQPHKINLCDLPKKLRILRIRMPVPSNYVYKSNVVKLFFNIMATTRIILLHLTNHLDLIHAHGDIFESFCQGIIGRVLHIPIILTIHGGINQKRFYLFLARYIFKLPNHIIVTGDTVKQQLLNIGLSDSKVSVISSGVNLDEFQHRDQPLKIMKSSLGLAEFDKVIVSVGRLHPVKGFEYLIKAFKSLKNRHDRACLVIIGDGPEKDNLIGLVDQESRIIFTGEKKKKQVVDYLLCADIFVLASVSMTSQEEGTPTAVMEAMSAGLPVIVTDSGSTKYLIRDGENGLIVPQRDIVALKEAIELLLENDNLRTRMGFANQRVAKSKDWSVISESVLKIYVNLIKG